MASQQASQVVVAISPKSVGVAIILTVLFGPLGMFYSTVTGGLVMTVVSVIVGVVTLGFGLLLTWPVCVLWAAMAARAHNNKLLGVTR